MSFRTCVYYSLFNEEDSLAIGGLHFDRPYAARIRDVNCTAIIIFNSDAIV